MNKKAFLFLLPVAAMAVVGCSKKGSGGGGGGDTDVKVTAITVASMYDKVATGDTMQFYATVTPENATNKEVVWSVEGAGATISESGLLSASTAGEVTVTATAKDGSGVKRSKIIDVEDGYVKPTVKAAYEIAEKLAKGATTTEDTEFVGVVTGFEGKSFFVQDGDYALMVYATEAYEGVSVGKLVNVKAILKNYNGLLETGGVTSVTPIMDWTVPAAVEVSSLAELAALKQNVKINFVGNMPAAPGAWSATNSPIVKVKIGTDDVSTKFSKNSYTEELGKIYNKSASKELTAKNAYTTAYDSSAGATVVNQIVTSNAIELSLPDVPATGVVCNDPGKIEVGKDVKLTATLTPADSTSDVEFAVTSGSEFLTIGGDKATGVAAGKAKIVAKANGITSAEVTVDVIEAIIPDAKLDFTANAYGMTIGTAIASNTFTPTGATITYGVVNVKVLAAGDTTAQTLYITKNTGCIYNDGAMGGAIDKIVIKTGDNASATCKYYLTTGDSKIATHQGTTSDGVIIPSKTEYTFDVSDAGQTFFNISANDKNGQINWLEVYYKKA